MLTSFATAKGVRGNLGSSLSNIARMLTSLSNIDPYFTKGRFSASDQLSRKIGMFTVNQKPKLAPIQPHQSSKLLDKCSQVLNHCTRSKTFFNICLLRSQNIQSYVAVMVSRGKAMEICGEITSKTQSMWKSSDNSKYAHRGGVRNVGGMASGHQILNANQLS